MKHILGKNKGFLIGGLVVAVVIIILIIVIVILAKKKQAKTVKLPKETSWGSSLTDEENSTVVHITEELYKDMKGLNIFSRNHQIYYEYSVTSDKIFVAVANYFAEKYGNGKNLAHWMKGEYYSWLSLQTDGLVDGILMRLAKFGITC